jgi:hypothetical protein
MKCTKLAMTEFLVCVFNCGGRYDRYFSFVILSQSPYLSSTSCNTSPLFELPCRVLSQVKNRSFDRKSLFYIFTAEVDFGFADYFLLDISQWPCGERLKHVLMH